MWLGASQSNISCIFLSQVLFEWHNLIVAFLFWELDFNPTGLSSSGKPQPMSQKNIAVIFSKKYWVVYSQPGNPEKSQIYYQAIFF